MIYYLIFIVLAFWAFLDLFVSNSILKSIPSILLILLVGLRSDNVGWDTIRYVNDYNQILWGFDSIQNFEFGFQTLEQFIAHYGLTVNVFFLVVSFLTICLLYINYHSFTSLGSVAILYYYSRFFLNRDMNQIRAALAAVIILYSIKFLRVNQKFKFLLVVFIATQFHSSSWIMLVVYPVFRILPVIRRYNGILILSFTFMFLFGFSFLISPILNVIFSILGTGSVYISYSGYIQGSGILNPVLIIQLSIIYLFAYQYFNNDNPNNTETALFATYFVSTALLILLNNYSVLAGRLSTMLATSEPILLIYIMQKKMNNLTVIVIMIILSLSLFYVLFIVNGNISQVFEPYIITFE